MPAQHLFTLIRAVPRPVTPDQFDPLIFANFSRFPGVKLLPDETLTATLVRNASTFGSPRLAVGPPDGEIDPPRIVNLTFWPPGIEVLAAPPDGVLRPGSLVNLSAFPTGSALIEAPADGVMRATAIIGAQAFHTVNVIDEGGGPDLDDYGPIALGPIAGDPL